MVNIIIITTVRARSPVPVAAPGRADRARSCVSKPPQAHDSAINDSNSKSFVRSTSPPPAPTSRPLYMNDAMDID
jgi:hypothetical protein